MLYTGLTLNVTLNLNAAVGSVSVTSDTIKKAAKRGSDNVVVQISATSAFAMRQTLDRRTSSSTCSEFEIIQNSNGEIVGQLAGDGLGIQGLKEGAVRVCLPTNKDIGQCFTKYPVDDFAIGDDDGRPGQPLNLATTRDKSDQVCGDLQL